jgi:galactokinase
MTGGGFGGCVIGLIDAGNVDAARDTVEQAYRERGFAPADVFTERAGPGAHSL